MQKIGAPATAPSPAQIQAVMQKFPSFSAEEALQYINKVGLDIVGPIAGGLPYAVGRTTGVIEPGPVQAGIDKVTGMGPAARTEGPPPEGVPLETQSPVSAPVPGEEMPEMEPPQQLGASMSMSIPGAGLGGIRSRARSRGEGALEIADTALSKSQESLGEYTQTEQGLNEELGGIQYLSAKEEASKMGEIVGAYEGHQATLNAIQKKQNENTAQYMKERELMSQAATYGMAPMSAVEELNDLKSEYESAQSMAEDENIPIKRRLQMVMETKKAYESKKRSMDQYTKIDPERAYTSTGKILSAISLALGSFGSALTGTPNHAYSIFKDTMDREIMRQRDQFDRRKGALNRLKTDYDLARQQTNDEFRATMLAQDNLLKKFNLELQKLGAKTKSQTQLIAVERAQNALNKLTAEHEMKVSQMSRDQALSDLRIEAQAASQQASMTASMMKGSGPGKAMPSSALNKMAEYNAVEEMLGSMLDTMSSQTDWSAFIEQYIPGSEAQDFQSQKEVITAFLTNAFSGAAFSDKEAARYSAMVPDAVTFTAKGKRQLQVLLSAIKTRKDSYTKTYGSAGYQTPAIEKRRKSKKKAPPGNAPLAQSPEALPPQD